MEGASNGEVTFLHRKEVKETKGGGEPSKRLTNHRNHRRKFVLQEILE